MFWAFPCNRHMEMCFLQNRSALYICSRTCSLSSVSGFSIASGVAVTVVVSGVTVSALGGEVRYSVMLHCAVLLLVLNAGPS